MDHNQNQQQVDHTKETKPVSAESNKIENPIAHTSDYAPYPKLDPKDVAPPAENWASVSMAAPPSQSHPGPTPISGAAATTMPAESNPYVSPAPVAPSSSKNTMDTVKDVLGKWGKKATEATKKAEDLAGNMWQHLKTGPSFADAAVGRIAHQTKVLAEGGYEKIFCQTFETVPEEQLQKTYACYLSTSSGPVMGVLYLSTAKLAFCSDNPLSYKVGEETQYSYYKLEVAGGTFLTGKMPLKVVIPLHHLKEVNPSTSKVKPGEKYIQIISVDNHEFWFMGIVHYDSAVKNLQGALKHSSP